MILDSYPRVPLGFFPTPVDPLERLGSTLGVVLSIKRDDFSVFGGGGNKVRKMEYLMAEALAQNAEVLITTGGHQSNHARVVAAAANRFGMRSALVLRGKPPTEYQGNLLLDRLFGATFEFLPPDEYFALIDGRMEAHAEEVRIKGEDPYVIPLGGASRLGALGYVRAADELAAQYEAAGARPPELIVLPLGSGGTMAGLLVGVRRRFPGTRVLGISVSRDSAWFRDRVSTIANETARVLGMKDVFGPDDVWVEDGYVGPGYGVPSPGSVEWIQRAARAEGVLLDPVYTDKAMHGLQGTIAAGRIAPGTRVLFLHCGGGPSLFPFAQSLVA